MNDVVLGDVLARSTAEMLSHAPARVELAVDGIAVSDDEIGAGHVEVYR